MTKKKKNIYWMIAGALCFFTALVHLIGGQLDLVNPLLDANLTNQAKTEWLSVWHGITTILFLSAFYLFKYGLNPKENQNLDVLQLIGILFILFSIVFIICSLWMKIFAPQWILLLPIGLLALKKEQRIIEKNLVP